MGVDAEDTLYVAGGYDGYIYIITQTGSITKISSGFPNPKHLVVTQSGIIYVVNDKGSLIQKITRDGTSAKFVDIGTQINGMALEGETIYVSYSDTIAQVDLNGSLIPIVQNLNGPTFFSIRNGVICVAQKDGMYLLPI